MQKINAKELLTKYENGECSDRELALLEEWYNQYAPVSPKKLSDSEWAEDVFSILKALDTANNVPIVKSLNWRRMVAAACILISVSTGGYFLISRPTHGQIAVLKDQDINPGGNKAFLTLADGRKIALNESPSGRLVQQGNTAVKKTADGVVVYQADQTTGDPVFNQINTPSGGQFHIVLADGTNAWLNASSSISFPTSFPGSTRVVEITGEVYFEVAHNAAKPFLVKSNGQSVEVLGTHFNINAYTNEPVMKTTLLQGSIRISSGGKSNLLHPGQQASVSKNNIDVGPVDTDQAVGWKNGDFIFDNEDLQTVMRQVSRWYNVDVVYKNKTEFQKFYGTISRTKKLSEILKALEMNQNVHFKTEGRTIEVMP